MLKLAKILHHKGFHITFVNTEYNHRCLLKSRGPDSLKNFHLSASRPFPMASHHMMLNNTSSVPTVLCIILDGVTSFTLAAAQELGTPQVFFWIFAACGSLGYMHYCNLREKGYTPFKGTYIYTCFNFPCFKMFSLSFFSSPLLKYRFC